MARGLPEAEPGPAGIRLPASAYRDLVLTLRARSVAYVDRARAYPEVPFRQVAERRPFEHQSEAVLAWRERGRGVVVLPTGAGKTHVAVMAIERIGRSALVLVPTLELLSQWAGALALAFGVDVGRYSGEAHDLRDLTVATYASACRHVGSFGQRFGLVVFDECHHLTAERYSLAARLSIAPYRLGLTATPGEADEAAMGALVGPVVFRREIDQMAGETLSEYEVVTVHVELDPAERLAYDEARAEYIGFLRDNDLRVGSPSGWRTFLEVAHRSAIGRRAYLAYRRQKALAQGAAGKSRALERILENHPGERTLIFTDDNDTAYRVSRELLVPALTYQTRKDERKAFLDAFRDGTLPVLATSRVLNEGVDVAEAAVAVVWSGTGSVREHVQRLGRILRRVEGKRAVLYELVARHTAEESVSARRRDHAAYSREGP